MFWRRFYELYQEHNLKLWVLQKDSHKLIKNWRWFGKRNGPKLNNKKLKNTKNKKSCQGGSEAGCKCRFLKKLCKQSKTQFPKCHISLSLRHMQQRASGLGSRCRAAAEDSISQEAQHTTKLQLRHISGWLHLCCMPLFIHVCSVTQRLMLIELSKLFIDFVSTFTILVPYVLDPMDFVYIHGCALLMIWLFVFPVVCQFCCSCSLVSCPVPTSLIVYCK